MNRILILMIFSCCIGSVYAQEEDPAAPPPLPPIDAKPSAPAVTPDDEGDVPLPPKVMDDSALIEPTVQIRRDDDDNLIEEYRSEGRVYMVKVTPKTGIPYYYIDDDGDGVLELAEGDAAAYPVKPAMWKIKEW